jgi:hypothetical protein
MAARKKQELEDAARAHIMALPAEQWRDMAITLHLRARDVERLRKNRDLPRLFKLENVVEALELRTEALEALSQQQTAQILDLQMMLGNALAAPALAAPMPQVLGLVPEVQCQTTEEVQELLDWVAQL